LTLGVLVLVLAGANSSLVAKPRVAEPGSAKSPVGEAIYLKGVLGSGAPLTATRAGAEPVTGEQAACVNCHRRSGLGSQEARSSFPPITGQFCFIR
jgi:cytochrome c